MTLGVVVACGAVWGQVSFGDSPTTKASSVSPRSEQHGFAYRLSNGPIAVAETESLMLRDKQRGKDLELRLFHPRQGGLNPVVIFSHGNCRSKDDYRWVGRFLSSHGYICIHPTHSDSFVIWEREGKPCSQGEWANRTLSDPERWLSRVQDVSLIIDSLELIEKKIPELERRINSEKIGVVGHSFGAHTAQIIGGARIAKTEDGPLTSFANERVDAVVLLSGGGRGKLGLKAESWKGLRCPMLCVTGTRDSNAFLGVKVDWRMEPYVFSPPGDKYLLLVEGMDHSLGTGARGRRVVPEHTEYVKMALIAFLDAYIKKESNAKDYLKSEKIGQFSNGAAILIHK